MFVARQLSKEINMNFLVIVVLHLKFLSIFAYSCYNPEEICEVELIPVDIKIQEKRHIPSNYVMEEAYREDLSDRSRNINCNGKKQHARPIISNEIKKESKFQWDHGKEFDYVKTNGKFGKTPQEYYMSVDDIPEPYEMEELPTVLLNEKIITGNDDQLSKITLTRFPETDFEKDEEEDLRYVVQEGSVNGNQESSDYGNEEGSRYSNQEGSGYGNQEGSGYGNQEESRDNQQCGGNDDAPMIQDPAPIERSQLTVEASDLENIEIDEKNLDIPDAHVTEVHLDSVECEGYRQNNSSGKINLKNEDVKTFKVKNVEKVEEVNTEERKEVQRKQEPCKKQKNQMINEKQKSQETQNKKGEDEHGEKKEVRPIEVEATTAFEHLIASDCTREK